MPMLSFRPAVLRAAVIASLRAARRRDVLANDHLVANLVEVVYIAAADVPDGELSKRCKTAAASGIVAALGAERRS
ncbi:MAG TPA: hypothetical protein VIN58_01065 [Roseateles sp.]